MENYIIRNPRNKLTEQEIDSFEESMNIKLPIEYRSFLLKYNGGKPEPNLIPIKDNPSDSHAMLIRLYCLAKGDNLDIIQKNKWLKGRLPNGFLAIGEDPGGNFICIDVLSNTGKIYFWAYEEEAPEGEPADFRNVYYIANSFQEMLDTLSG